MSNIFIFLLIVLFIDENQKKIKNKFKKKFKIFEIFFCCLFR